MILVVVVEALSGIICPLTIWENALRGNQIDTGFVAHWVGQLIYYDLPGWVFTTAYVAFAAALIVTLLLVPPGKAGAQRNKARRSSPPDNN